jgi:hypothetical protein
MMTQSSMVGSWWRVGLVGAALLGAIGCGATGRSSPFSDGRGFGLQATRPSSVPGATSAELRSPNWDVALGIKPGSAQVSEGPDSWTASNESTASPQAGQFLFMVLRNPDIEGASVKSVATLLREDEMARGVAATDITEAEFMGLPGAMYVSFPDEGLFNVTLLTVSQKCVYILNVTRSGDQESVADYFGALVGVIDTYSGGPANAPACR